MAPPATPRFEAPIQSHEEMPASDRLGPAPVEDAPILTGEVELVGVVDPRQDTSPRWNTAPLLDALVEMHNPMMENP